MTESKETKANKTNDKENESGNTERFAFQTEMQQLLHILIHSLYSEREIFLRELISNASDAINKLKFNMLTQSDVRDKDAELEISLEVDTENHVLTITDTGIGMNREEAGSNLGTIARSGTLDFVKQFSSADPNHRADLIGQFGVGFYSVFMVAARVVVDSCPADPKQKAIRWVSEGEGDYTMEDSDRKHRGTSIRIELKEDAHEFASEARVENIVNRYSAFIPHPIRLDSRRLNMQQAIWAQSKGSVKDEEYEEFYKFISHGTDGPMHSLHLSIDAPVQYQALLYIPKKLTNEVLYSPTGFGLELYANKVSIQQDSQDLLPLYLRFLRGVVDTEDLPLNVSREMIQNNPLVARLRKSLTGRVLRELKALADNSPDTYQEFWKQYGMVFKEGITTDTDNRERLLELFRFNSSHFDSADGQTSLAEYASRMKPDQKEILYFSGPSRESIERNPHLEYFRKQELEVLYLTDQVDDFVMAHLFDFEGKPLASIDQSDLETLKTEENEEAPAEGLEGEPLDALITGIKEILGEQVSDVKASRRLVDSPALLVSADGMSGSLGKVMKRMNKDFQSMPKVLEINPAHPLIQHMSTIREKDAQDAALKDLAEQLFDNCLLVEGLVEHPERMVSRIQSLMTLAAQAEADKK